MRLELRSHSHAPSVFKARDTCGLTPNESSVSHCLQAISANVR